MTYSCLVQYCADDALCDEQDAVDTDDDLDGNQPTRNNAAGI